MELLIFLGGAMLGGLFRYWVYVLPSNKQDKFT